MKVLFLAVALGAAFMVNQPAKALPVQDNLIEMSDSLRKMAHADKELSAEMNRHTTPGLSLTDDMVMEPGNMNPVESPLSQDTGAARPLPPRRHWVDLAMADLKETIAVLGGQIQDLGTAFGASRAGARADEFKAQLDVLNDTYKTLQDNYQKLVPMTRQSNYAIRDVDTLAQAIHDDLKGMNEERVRLLKLAREIEKESK